MPTSRNITCHYGSSSTAQQPPSNDLNPKENRIRLASYLGPSVAKHQDPDGWLTSHLFATLRILNLQIEGVLDGYLRSIHEWIPIIHPISLKEQVHHCGANHLPSSLVFSYTFCSSLRPFRRLLGNITKHSCRRYMTTASHHSYYCRHTQGVT